MRKAMFESVSLEPDDRNFEQQMADLNVPIEPLKRKPGRPARVLAEDPAGVDSPSSTQSKPAPEPQLAEVTWIRKTAQSTSTLGEKISLTKYNITLGKVAVEKVARAAEEEVERLGFGVTPLKKGHALVIAVNDSMGFDVKKTKAGSITVANKGVANKLLAAGLTCGRYRLDKQYGTLWTAVLEGE